jgi:multidrug efflux pump
VIDDAEDVRQAAWMNDTPAVILNIQRQPSANIIAVVDRVRRCCRSCGVAAAGDRQRRF